MSMASQLAAVPADRVVQILGAPLDTVAAVLAASSTDLAPVVAGTTGCSSTSTARAPRQRTSPGEFVGSALHDLERVAVELLPVWLPEAAGLDRPDVGGIAAIRMIAMEHARHAHYPPLFLTGLAVLAISGQRETAPELPLRTRAVQLARLVAEGFRRPRAVLLVEPGAELTVQDQDAVVAGAGWLAHNARMAVWLVGGLPLSDDRVPFVRVTGTAGQPSAPTGKPHPASAVEQALEAALARESWAGGRQWNQGYQSDALSPPVRLDLLWPVERCVVELDGPEHCHPVHFEADRQRDVQLQLDGYAVLRFTNARVIHDVGAVVHQIGTYIRGRRNDLLEGSTPWPTTSPRPRTPS
jgi:very-short-patch-repair endonuclease